MHHCLACFARRADTARAVARLRRGRAVRGARLRTSRIGLAPAARARWHAVQPQ